jgi:NADPH2:quinone reductase
MSPSISTAQILVEVEAAGVNYIDVYQRTGNLDIPKPFTPGYEGVGRIREVGPGVANFKPGRVAVTCAANPALKEKAKIGTF